MPVAPKFSSEHVESEWSTGHQNKDEEPANLMSRISSSAGLEGGPGDVLLLIGNHTPGNH